MPRQLEAKGVGPRCPPRSMGLLVIWLSFQPHLTHTLFSIHTPSGCSLFSSWRTLRCFVMFPNTPPSPLTAQPVVSLLPPRCSWSTVPHVLLTLGCRCVSPQACKATALAARVPVTYRAMFRWPITFGTNECALASQQLNKQKPNQQQTAGLIPNWLSQGQEGFVCTF